jgi:uncharacterized protein (TIGR02246 family)
MMRKRLFRSCLLFLPLVTAAAADETADKAAISRRLTDFSAAFAARDASKACDLFAADLIATTPLAPDVSKDMLCRNFERLFAKPGLQLHYDAPEIREIIVSGDLAIVRVIWTLRARAGSEVDTTQEGAIDIFRRDGDGRWSIMRMNAFSFRPNKVLD